MKKLIALALIAALTGVPAVTFAEGETTTSNHSTASTPTNSGFDLSSLTNNIGGTDNASDANSELANCQSSSLGGSLGGLSSGGLSSILGSGGLSSLMQGAGSSDITRIIGSLTGNSSTGKIISDLLQGKDISSILSGGSVKSLLGGLFGNSGIGNTIGSLLGGNSSGLGSLLGGSSGLGSILGGSSSGLGSLGGSFGGMAGGALGIVGGAFGGGEVPVNDGTVRSNTQKIQGNTQQIQTDQDTYIKKVCVQDVLVRQSSHMFASDFSQTVVEEANTGNAGLPVYSQNIAQDAQTLSDAVHDDFVKNILPNSGIDSKILREVQNNVDQAYQKDNKFSLKCPVEGAQDFLQDYSKGGLDMFRTVLVDYPECTPIGATVAARGKESALIASRLQEQEEIVAQAEGIFPKIECLDDGGGDKPLQQCVHYRIVGPASVAKDTLNRGVGIGAEQQARASQIGDLVDSLFAKLAQKAFTSLGGLMSLSKQSSTGNGSYLEQASGNASNTAITSAKNAVRTGINSALETEDTYQALVVDILDNLDATKTVYTSLKVCYERLSTGSTAGNPSTAWTKANAASTTIKTVLDPQITLYERELTDSVSIITILQSIKSRINNATTVAEVNAASSAFNSLAVGGKMHTDNELSLIASDHDSSKVLLDSMKADANVELTECRKL